MPEELLLQDRLGRRVFGEHHNARRVPIDSVNGQRPPCPMRAQVPIDLIEHRVGARLPLERHREQSRRLVHGNQIIVFIQDVEIASPMRCRPPLRAARSI
jgi:hypothetical protein